jgi:hypothetical protein
MVQPPHSKLLAEYFDACLDAAVHGEVRWEAACGQ